MSDITTKILFESEIETLGQKFEFLKNNNAFNSVFKNWKYTKTHRLGYKKLKKLNVIFIGQTGYGKSSLINELIGNNAFQTSDYEACTKSLQSADYFLGHDGKKEKLAHVLSFVDLPGIGENDKADEQYLNWYKEYIQQAAVIVYLFRADKRDHTQDEFFFKHIFDNNLSDRLICVVSQADKIEPLNRGTTLSDEQNRNLEKKKAEINCKSFLDFTGHSMLHVSSQLHLNMDKFENELVHKLKGLKKAA